MIGLALFAAVTMSSATTEVVIAPDAPQTVVFAAQEATNFLSCVFGVPVAFSTAPTAGKVSLVLGDNAWSRAAGIDVAKLPRDGFAIRTGDDRIYIAGRDDPKTDLTHHIANGAVHLAINEHATSFGVYEFLERFAGVRFYFPGEFGTVVPRRTEITVPETDETCAPKMTVRTTTLTFDGAGEWFENPEDKVTRRRGQALEFMRTRFGTLDIPCCHGQNQAHMRERFAETHPEYFALLKTWDRKEPYRDVEATSKSHHPGQLCHTSAVWDEFYEDAKAYLSGQAASARRVPSRWRKGECAWGRNMLGEYVDMMCQDGFQPCQCERCRAAYDRDAPNGMYATELIWGQTVRLANRLKADGIGGIVTQMAYPPYRNVPEFVEIPDNVRVMVAETGPWSCGNPEKVRLQYDEIAAWAKKCRRPVWLWTYPRKGEALTALDIPQMAPRAYHRFFRTAAQDIFGAFAEDESDKWIYNYLNTYVFMKTLWNPDLDVDELLDEHARLMFGPGADEMKAFYEALEEKWIGTMTVKTHETSLGPQTLPPSPHRVMTEVYPLDALREWDRMITAAWNKCPKGSLERRRVKFIRDQFLVPLVKRVRIYADERSVERELARRKAHPEEVNLVDNGDLSQTNKWGNSANWSVYPQPKCLDSQVYVSAPCSLYVANTNRQYAGCHIGEGKLKPGRSYRFSYFLKLKDVVKHGGSGSGVHLAMICGGNEVRVPGNRSGLDGTTDWLHYSGVFKMPENPTDEYRDGLLCLRLMDASGEIWLDDMLVTEVE